VANPQPAIVATVTNFFRLQTKIEDIEILPHMVDVGCPHQWIDANLKREPKDNLWDCSTVACRNLG